MPVKYLKEEDFGLTNIEKIRNEGKIDKKPDGDIKKYKFMKLQDEVKNLL